MSFQYFKEDSHVLTYDKFRPKPPQTLIEDIISFLKEKVPRDLELAVDVGCGSGQSTEKLAPYFKSVIGLDPSESIVNQATKKNIFKNVEYSCCSAEQMKLLAESADLITTVQAVHWFDLPKFYNEVNRILRKNGVLAVYGYELPVPIDIVSGRNLGSIVKKYYVEVLKDYILPESKKVYLEKYHGKEFNEVPFNDGQLIRKEGYETKISAKLSDLLGYISSWSGFQNFKNQHGGKKSEEVLENFATEIREATGNQELDLDLTIVYNYFLLIGRK